MGLLLKRFECYVMKFRLVSCIFNFLSRSTSNLYFTVDDKLQKRLSIIPSLYSCPLAIYLPLLSSSDSELSH